MNDRKIAFMYNNYILYNTVEPLYCGHTLGLLKVRGVLISEVGLYWNVVVGTLASVLIIKVSLFQSVLIREVPLYTVYAGNHMRRLNLIHGSKFHEYHLELIGKFMKFRSLEK